MSDTRQDAWQTAYNETDLALIRIEGLSIALEGLVEREFNNNDDASLALTALAKTLNEKVAAALELRSTEFRAGQEATKAAC